MGASLGQQQTTLVSNAVSTQIAGTNPKRVAIVLFSPSANRVTINFGNAAVLDAGPTIQPGVNPYRITVDDVGELIQRAIFGIAATAPTNLSIVEEMDL